MSALRPRRVRTTTVRTYESKNVMVSWLRPAKDDIKPDRSEKDIQDLMHSIREQGFLGALSGFEIGPEEIEVIDGTTRLHALLRLGIREVPVVIVPKPEDPAILRLWRMRPNLIHAQMSALSQASNYLALMREKGWSQKELAQQLGGKHFESRISKALKLFRLLVDELKAELSAGKMSERAAYAHCALPAERQVPFWASVDGLKVERIEEMAAEEVAKLAGSAPKVKLFIGSTPGGLKFTLPVDLAAALAESKKLTAALTWLAGKRLPFTDLDYWFRTNTTP